MHSANSSVLGSQIGMNNRGGFREFSASHDDINQLEKRNMVLNLMIKSCELLEYLTRTYKSSYNMLEIDPLSLKKMASREHSNIHVEFKRVSSESSLSSATNQGTGQNTINFTGVKIYNDLSNSRFEQY